MNADTTLNEFERRLLHAWRTGSGTPPAPPSDDQPASWVPFAMHFALVASRAIRAARLGDLDGSTIIKGDGSPATALERAIEERIALELRQSGLPVTLHAEETAPERGERGTVLALDPVDGTWSLVNRTETAATSLAVLRDGRPTVGIVSNPATAEIAYAADGQPPRLIQLAAFGEADRAVSLPIPPAGPEGVLVSVHPQRAAGPIMTELSRAWRDGELDMVRSPGGAPSLGFLEAAKGNFVYVNLWNRRESAVWDLSAGLLLVRAAGGDAVDLDGRPIRNTGHRGPFVVALNREHRNRVVALLSGVLNRAEV